MLIDADALIKHSEIIETPYKENGRWWARYSVDVNDIKEAPTIDPVRHGKWKYRNNFSTMRCEGVVCSECGEFFEGMSAQNYCPNCGVQMFGGDPK